MDTKNIVKRLEKQRKRLKRIRNIYYYEPNGLNIPIISNIYIYMLSILWGIMENDVFNINVTKRIERPTTVLLDKTTVKKLRSLVHSGVTINQTLDRILTLLDRETYLRNQIENWEEIQNSDKKYDNLETLREKG